MRSLRSLLQLDSSDGSFVERALRVLRRLSRGYPQHDVQETNDAPVVGRRVTDEAGSTPDAYGSFRNAGAGPARGVPSTSSGR
jgi:hypothetical protein